MEKAMAPHSSTLAWKIPWAEEPGGLQSMGSWRVGHNWATSLSRIREGNGDPLQCSCLENPRDGGAWWSAIYGITQSRTGLKWLSSSSEKWEGNFPVKTDFLTLCPIWIFSFSTFLIKRAGVIYSPGGPVNIKCPGYGFLSRCYPKQPQGGRISS